MNGRQFAELLNQEEVAGRIIKDVAVLDWLLGDVIAVYFTPDLSRYAAFSELVLSGMSFHQKIEVLKGLKLEKQYRCLEALHALQRFKKLRNLVAHRYHIGDHHVEKLLSDPAIVRMFDGWPVNYRSEVSRTKFRLRRLAITREFTRYEVPARA